MPKMTAKYKGAVETARSHNLPVPATKNQEALYDLLQKNSFFWDSRAKQWNKHDLKKADPATELVNLRVWAEAETVEFVARDIAAMMQAQGYRLVETSKPYLCRPPKQLEARVYLKFLPPVGVKR